MLIHWIRDARDHHKPEVVRELFITALRRNKDFNQMRATVFGDQSSENKHSGSAKGVDFDIPDKHSADQTKQISTDIKCRKLSDIAKGT